MYFAEIGSVSGKRPNQSIKLAGYGVYCETQEISYADLETSYTSHRVTSSDLAHIFKSGPPPKLYAWIFTEMTPVAAWTIPYRQGAQKFIKFDKPSIVKPDLAMLGSAGGGKSDKKHDIDDGQAQGNEHPKTKAKPKEKKASQARSIGHSAGEPETPGDTPVGEQEISSDIVRKENFRLLRKTRPLCSK
jgi:hypothetical protein